jgi:hypothetical protein
MNFPDISSILRQEPRVPSGALKWSPDLFKLEEFPKNPTPDDI